MGMSENCCSDAVLNPLALNATILCHKHINYRVYIKALNRLYYYYKNDSCHATHTAMSQFLSLQEKYGV